MWNFSLGTSLTLLARTMPFLLLRCAVYFGVSMAYVVFAAVGSALGWSIGALGDRDFQAATTLWGGVAGLGITAWGVFLLREYLLYLVKAAHIAAMVQLLDGGELPAGKSQIDHARSVVQHRFGQANVLFVMDQLVKGVITVITGVVRGISNVLPIPGITQLAGLVRAFLRLAVGLVDEVILAYAIRTDSQNPWQSARMALVLYAQNAPGMLKNAAWLTAMMYALSLLVFVLFLAPAAALVYLLPGSWGAAAAVFALVFAWALKASIMEPFAVACLLQAYFGAIEGQQPDPQWEARLDGLSGKFTQLKEKAATWAGKSASPDQRPSASGAGSP